VFWLGIGSEVGIASKKPFGAVRFHLLDQIESITVSSAVLAIARIRGQSTRYFDRKCPARKNYAHSARVHGRLDRTVCREYWCIRAMFRQAFCTSESLSKPEHKAAQS
jgi:hypothetical protein